MSIIPPSSPVCEQSLIACLTCESVENLAAALELGARVEWFTSPFTQRAFEHTLKLHAQGRPVSLGYVLEQMGTVTSSPETDAFLACAASHQGSLSSTLAHCRELSALHARRRALRLFQEGTEAAQSNPDGVGDVIAQLLTTQSDAHTARPWTRVCEDALGRVDAVTKGEVENDGSLSWTWEKLDQKFRPFRRKELVVIAGRTSMGKSSLTRQILQRSALQGRHVLLESLEVSADEVADQMATALSGHPFGELARLHPSDQKSFRRALEKLRSAPLAVFEDSTLSAIVARVKAVHASRPLDLIGIDYLGQIADCEGTQNGTKAQAVGRVTKALKRLAMELNTVILLAAQVNRGPANEGNREPRLSDLRDSGDIEQDADRVVFIHRPDENPFTKENQDALDPVDETPRFGVAFLQAKGRNVGTGFGAVWFNRRLARFEVEECP